ncbi:response regulator transcription factor [Streptomyces sp. NPDC048629]|uniref:LytR/AlgR family response regulator transcription factor n=1 Tax=Streptomyces sp. NPDC048629 TaxID=3154824 RepID=UPI003420A3B5
MLHVLAVDDEEPALEELLYLLRADPRVGSAEGATEATEALRLLGRAMDEGRDGADAIDVVFLDINMPGLTGLDMARLLSGFASPPRIIFVTAHEDFAVQAFELQAVDYLLKPLRKERLAEAVRRVADLVEADRQTTQPTGTPPTPASAQERRTAETGAPAAVPVDRIAVELGGVTRYFASDTVFYAEAQGDYARLYTRDGASHLVRVPLATLEERWQPSGFVRIHRRYLVSVADVQELRVEAGLTTVRVGGAELAVSRRNARELRDLLVRQAESHPKNGRVRPG